MSYLEYAASLTPPPLSGWFGGAMVQATSGVPAAGIAQGATDAIWARYFARYTRDALQLASNERSQPRGRVNATTLEADEAFRLRLAGRYYTPTQTVSGDGTWAIRAKWGTAAGIIAELAWIGYVATVTERVGAWNEFRVTINSYPPGTVVAAWTWGASTKWGDGRSWGRIGSANARAIRDAIMRAKSAGTKCVEIVVTISVADGGGTISFPGE